MHVIVLWVAAAITSEYDGGDAFLCTFFYDTLGNNDQERHRS